MATHEDSRCEGPRYMSREDEVSPPSPSPPPSPPRCRLRAAPPFPFRSATVTAGLRGLYYEREAVARLGLASHCVIPLTLTLTLTLNLTLPSHQQPYRQP